ncbi:MAG: hypothetical protein V4565_11770 [Bacteroidota bacterium]
MKTSNSPFKNNSASFLICVVMLVIYNSASAQNKLASIVTSENFCFLLPVVCVLGLAIFLMTAFLKQKNH